MKSRYSCLWLLLILFLTSCEKSEPTPKERMARFAKEKEIQARQLGKAESDRWPVEFDHFFSAAESGNWDRAVNIYAEMRQKYSVSSTAPTNGWGGAMVETYAALSKFGITSTNYWPNPLGPQWRPIDDVYYGIGQFRIWDPELMRLYMTNIANSIPPDAIFLTGTESGFFVVPAMTWSPTNHKSFITISPNKFADANYLKYLSHLYDRVLKVPAAEDLSDAYSTYYDAVQDRAAKGKLMPGESYPSIAGDVAVMQINGLMLKTFITTNHNREIYYEEHFPIDWIVPYLIPNGLVSKVSQSALTNLDPSVVERDRTYWRGLVRTLTGFDADVGTPAFQFLDFGEKVYDKKDLSQFKGNPRFATNQAAQWTFAECRLNLARIYMWRANNGLDLEERRRMAREADFAFGQSLALCPPEYTAGDYGLFLYTQNRTNDLQLLAQRIRTIAPTHPNADYLSMLLTNRP
jgi:hypothetical protein